MEGPVKERLTGALIFVAAVGIIVPEILSGPDPEAVRAAPAPTQTVDAGPPLRTYSMVLNGSPDQRQEALVPQPTAPEPATAQPSAADPAPVEVAGSPAAMSETVPVAAAPSPPGRESPKPVASISSPAGMWWTQLGSFSARDNAERLARELRAAGFSIDVTKVSAGGKELYRVRAGPVSGRQEALALQSRLLAAGHKAPLVAP